MADCMANFVRTPSEVNPSFFWKMRGDSLHVGMMLDYQDKLYMTDVLGRDDVPPESDPVYWALANVSHTLLRILQG